MTLPVYPGRTLLPGLTYSSKWSPQFFNLSPAITATGAQLDLGLAQYPLHQFELVYEFLRDGPIPGRSALAELEFRTMMGFLLLTSGTRGRFLYRNPDDHQVFQNQIGIGDGATTTFLLTRTFGANGYFGTEPVGQVDTSAPFNAYLNGSSTPVSPSLYSVSAVNPVASTITFTSPPGGGQKVCVDMSYFYYCKLADNSNTVEKFMDRLWLLSKIALQSCRGGT